MMQHGSGQRPKNRQLKNLAQALMAPILKYYNPEEQLELQYKVSEGGL